MKFFYIYNPYQSNFFIQNGVYPLECGKGRSGDVFLKFMKTDKSQEIFERWMELSKNGYIENE